MDTCRAILLKGIVGGSTREDMLSEDQVSLALEQRGLRVLHSCKLIQHVKRENKKEKKRIQPSYIAIIDIPLFVLAYLLLLLAPPYFPLLVRGAKAYSMSAVT
jgi:hypothetical protein